MAFWLCAPHHTAGHPRTVSKTRKRNFTRTSASSAGNNPSHAGSFSLDERTTRVNRFDPPGFVRGGTAGRFVESPMYTSKKVSVASGSHHGKRRRRPGYMSLPMTGMVLPSFLLTAMR